MSHDISCGTDPFDQSQISHELAARWFGGLSQSFTVREAGKDILEPLDLVHENRRIQRVDDETGIKSIEINIDPKHILPDEDLDTEFVVWKDSFGRDRRIRRNSSTGKSILALAKSPTDGTVGPKRHIASYDDI